MSKISKLCKLSFNPNLTRRVQIFSSGKAAWVVYLNGKSKSISGHVENDLFYPKEKYLSLLETYLPQRQNAQTEEKILFTKSSYIKSIKELIGEKFVQIDNKRRKLSFRSPNTATFNYEGITYIGKVKRFGVIVTKGRNYKKKFSVILKTPITLKFLVDKN